MNTYLQNGVWDIILEMFIKFQIIKSLNCGSKENFKPFVLL